MATSTVVAQPPPVCSDLVAVSTKEHATPTAMMRFGAVSEPEHARLVFTPFHQFKVSPGQQLSSSFSHRSKNRLGAVFSPDFFDPQRAWLVPNEPGVTAGVRQKTVKDGRISPLSGLVFFNKGANILPQRPGGI
jgi:hypothetical protein